MSIVTLAKVPAHNREVVESWVWGLAASNFFLRDRKLNISRGLKFLLRVVACQYRDIQAAANKLSLLSP